jgi:hypothetical protein
MHRTGPRHRSPPPCGWSFTLPRWAPPLSRRCRSPPSPLHARHPRLSPRGHGVSRSQRLLHRDGCWRVEGSAGGAHRCKHSGWRSATRCGCVGGTSQRVGALALLRPLAESAHATLRPTSSLTASLSQPHSHSHIRRAPRWRLPSHHPHRFYSSCSQLETLNPPRAHGDEWLLRRTQCVGWI